MNDPFVERMRRALAPDFQVERPLGAGGMGIVLLAREISLDRWVAIKTIKPELATAVAVERFQREARMLARVSHTNIVPIHSLQERDGLLCIVMEYVPDETLAQRLERGPLPAHEVVRIGRDMLAALQVAHERGVIHRDIKPGNIFLSADRALLADFGISKALGRQTEAITTTDSRPMTVLYASPEQRAGAAVGPASDLYSLAAVLYEALTGRVWTASTASDDPRTGDWRGVPAILVAALQRGLAAAPGERWPSAEAFAGALGGRRRLFSRRWAATAALAVVLLGVSVKLWWPWVVHLVAPEPPITAIADVVLGPFRPPDPGLRLREVVYDLLRNAGGLELAPLRDDSAVGASDWPAAQDTITGVVEQVDGGQRVALLVDGREIVVSGEPGEIEWEMGLRIALRILEVVKPDAFLAPACKPQSVESYRAFIRGQEAFRRDDWVSAISRFEEAVARDPGYCLAQVRLWLAQRWSRRVVTVDLAHLLARYGGTLAREDSLLIAAELAPTRAQRWALYADAMRRRMFGALAPLQYGGDLTHRGPLDGLPLDSGVTILREARERDPQLASTHDQLMWALTRLGYRDSAWAALQVLRANARVARDVDPSVFELIWAMRFLPAESVLPRLGTAGEGAQAQIMQRVRLALSFDLAPYQALIGAQLAAQAGASMGLQAHGRVATGIALLALGRPVAGLAQLDSAAAIATPHRAELTLQVAQWRVLAASLGIPGVPDTDVTAARRTLDERTGDAAIGGRASWTLAIDAWRRGDTTGAQALAARVPVRDSALRDILAAVAVGRQAPQQALAKTAPWRGVREEQSGLGEPFARAILHLRRAEWFAATGEPDRAERERRWHENSDFEGWLAGPIQAAEVDWVAGAYVRVREGMRRLDANDRAACADLLRVVDTLWTDVEPYAARLRDDGRAQARGCR